MQSSGSIPLGSAHRRCGPEGAKAPSHVFLNLVICKSHPSGAGVYVSFIRFINFILHVRDQKVTSNSLEM